jgi:hypothetical protein
LRKRARAAAALAAAACLSACATPAGIPELAGLAPFVWPRAGQLSLITCRWEPALPIGVRLEGATREEQTAAESALRAIAGAGLGLRFLAAPAEHAQLTIAFADGPLERASGSPAAGRTIADCALQADGRAELAAARIEIARQVPTARGALRSPEREELLGTLVHELGHALGWSGHARRGDPLLDAAPEAARRAGAALLAGTPLDSPGLRALYARPSGEALLRAPVTAAQTQLVDRLARLAAENALAGPYLRSGDVAARVFWRDPRTRLEYGLQILEPAKLLRDPRSLRVAPEARARRALPRSRDAVSGDAPASR